MDDIILKELSEIRAELRQLSANVKTLLESSQKMNDHIGFVETTYETLKAPLHYITAKINCISGKPLPQSVPRLL